MNRHERQLRLDRYFQQINSVILSRQHPLTGLLPASTAVNAHGDYTDAWVRDNVYSIISAWGLALAYRKLDNNQGRAYLLEQSVVKLMRGLLIAQMKQADKVEQFKNHQSAENALHAKYETQTGEPVVGDDEWGHLQLDATSLYLLMLAQMTASGLRIVYTLDEVDFIQNLVHYIGRAYRTPDYGIWERGHKINHGLRELNASSIGMAKAALEAMRELNLFGPEGGSDSVIHVVADEIARTRSTLHAILPRESGSKEVDAALLSVVGFPAFAIEDPELAQTTRHSVIGKLQGRYGCKRFLLDGHQTVLEDSNRLHYEPHELKQFEHIESEWPLFFTYLLLDALFRHDQDTAQDYRTRLEDLAIDDTGQPLLPELFYVPLEAIEQERAQPHSQPRLANENLPLVWAQSLFYLGTMIQDGLLEITDIDPLQRHLSIGRERSTCVQIALLAEDAAVQRQLLDQGVVSETLQEVAPIQVRTAKELAEALYLLGKNDKLQLTGRPPRRIRSLTTSQVFQIHDDTVVFLPELLNQKDFYLNHDNKLLVEQLKNELIYHQRNWDIPGRPLIVLKITAAMLNQEGQNDLIRLIGELQQGEVNDIPVRLGRLAELMTTAAKKRLAYLDDYQFEAPPQTTEDKPGQVLKYDPLKTRPLSAAQEQRVDLETAPTELIERLHYSDNPYLQIAILTRLVDLVGFEHVVNTAAEEAPRTDVCELVKELYDRAVMHHLWSVVRQAAILLDKHDAGLEDAVTELLVRQKLVDLGRSYTNEALVVEPRSNAEIIALIEAYGGDDKRLQILCEEVLIYLGALIKADPKLFDQILTLRVYDLVALLIYKTANEYGLSQSEAFEILLQLRPHEIQLQLRTVLEGMGTALDQVFNLETLHYCGVENDLTRVVFQKKEDPEAYGGYQDWRDWRQHHGVLTRMADSFYVGIWNVLGGCPGIVIGDRYERSNYLDADLRSATTANEQNFALVVAQLLNKIHAAEYRHLTIEALTTLAAIFRANPELRISEAIVLDVIIGHAVRQAWLDQHPDHADDYERHKAQAWEAFYLMPPHETASAMMDAFIFLLSPDNASQTGTQSSEELAS